MHIYGTWIPGNINRPEEAQLDFCDKGLTLKFGPFAENLEDEQQLLILEGQIFDLTIQEAFGDPKRFETAYGHFAYVWYDKINNEVSIGTDRFGFFPLYYAYEDGRFIFGASLGQVKSSLKQRSPDYEAWEELMTLGEVLGEKTTVKQIKRLSDGTRIQIKNGKLSFIRYWYPELSDQVDEGTYIRENNRLLDEAMSLTKDIVKRKVVLLSGGEDSRRIALAATRQHLNVDFYTQESVYKRGYGRYVDRDVKLAKQLSQILGRPHFVESMPSLSQSLADYMFRDTSLGFECTAHEWLLPLTRRIKPVSLIYDGIVGDITINGHYFKEFPAAIDIYKDLRSLAHLISGNASHSWLNEIRQRTESSLEDRIEQLLATYPDSPHRLTYYFVCNHARRKISCVAQLFGAHGHSTCYPFLYYPLFLQSLSIDPRLQITKYYQRECMGSLSTAILSIPTTREHPLDEVWLIDRDSEMNSQEKYMLSSLVISDEALDMFPRLRARYRLLSAYRGITGRITPFKKYGWFMWPLERYSSFLRWLESDKEFN